jgi:hypothetical protein
MTELSNEKSTLMEIDSNEEVAEENDATIHTFKYNYIDETGVLLATASNAAAMWNKMLDITLPLHNLMEYFFWYDWPIKRKDKVIKYGDLFRQIKSFPAIDPELLDDNMLDLDNLEIDANLYLESRQETNQYHQIRYIVDDILEQYKYILKQQLIDNNDESLGKVRLPNEYDFSYFIKYFPDYFIDPLGTRIGTTTSGTMAGAISGYWGALKAWANDKSNPKPEFPHWKRSIRSFSIDKKGASVIQIGETTYIKISSSDLYNVIRRDVKLHYLTHDWKTPYLCTFQNKKKNGTVLVAQCRKKLYYVYGHWFENNGEYVLNTRVTRFIFKGIKYFSIPELHLLKKYQRDVPVKFVVEDAKTGEQKYFNCTLLELGIPTYEDFSQKELKLMANQCGVKKLSKLNSYQLYDELAKRKVLQWNKNMPETKRSFFYGNFFYVPFIYPRNMPFEQFFEVNKYEKLVGTRFHNITFKPRTDGTWKIIVGYEVEPHEYEKKEQRAMAIDLNSKRVIACITFNFSNKCFLISSKGILNIKHKYANKKKYLQQLQAKEITTLLKKQYPTETNEELTKRINVMRHKGQILTTKRMKYLDHKQEDEINFETHKITHFIEQLVIHYGIEQVFIGYNKGWKQKQKQKAKVKREAGEYVMSKADRTDFQSIPYYTIYTQLQYKLGMYSISVTPIAEEYTKLASAIDLDVIPKLDKKDKKDKKVQFMFSGKRFKRERGHTHRKCWYQAKRINAWTGKPYLIYGDMNDSLNIMRIGIKNDDFILKMLENPIPNPIYLDYRNSDIICSLI